MKREDVRTLLECFQARHVKCSQDWCTCSCLFAPWTHKGGADNNPSFGISIHVGGESGFNCWSCEKRGISLFDMLMELRLRYRRDGREDEVDWATAFALVDKELDEFDVGDIPTDYEEAKKKPDSLVVFPEDWLASFKKWPDHPYSLGRGISKQVGMELDLRYDSSKKRICFPVRDGLGRLAGMQGRDVTGQSSLRYLSYGYYGKYNRGVWLNENRVNWNKLVIVTEGPFDLAKISMVYSNVLGSMTSAISEGQLKTLEQAVSVLSMYDVGTGGDKARKTLGKTVGKTVNLQHYVPEEDVGDAGNMTEEAIDDLVEEAMQWM